MPTYIDIHMFHIHTHVHTLGWRLKWSCNCMFLCSNALTTMLECWGNWAVRGMCVLGCFNAHMLLCSCACILPLTCLYALMLKCSHTHTHTHTYAWRMMCLWSWMLVQSHAWILVQSLAIIIVLKCLGDWIVRCMCTWMLNSHMLVCSHALLITWSPVYLL